MYKVFIHCEFDFHQDDFNDIPIDLLNKLSREWFDFKIERTSSHYIIKCRKSLEFEGIQKALNSVRDIEQDNMTEIAKQKFISDLLKIKEKN